MRIRGWGRTLIRMRSQVQGRQQPWLCLALEDPAVRPRRRRLAPGSAAMRSRTLADAVITRLQTFRMPREIMWAVGRLRMARTRFPPAPGSRHRGSVGARPRCGGRAACPPAPNDSPSLGTHEGARRPVLYGGTSARLAAAPCTPFLRPVPHMGDNPTPNGNECHPAFYTQRASHRMTVRNGWTMTSGR